MRNFEWLREYTVKALRHEIGAFQGQLGCSKLVENLENIVRNIEEIPDDPGPESKCMSNRKILMNIWKYSTNAEVLNFRCVNRQWCRLGTTVLLKRIGVHVRLYGSGNSGSYLVNSVNSDLYLEMLNDCLRMSGRFPLSELRIKGGKLDEPDLIEFLNLHGSKIKSLVLWKTETAVHLANLFRLMPHIECLKIIEFGPSNQSSTYEEHLDSFDFFPSDLALVRVPALKHLAIERLDRIPGNFDLLSAVARSTQCLQSISLPQMKFLVCFSDYAPLIKQITFDSPHDIQLCSSFTNLETKLSGLTIDLSVFGSKLKTICMASPHLESLLVSNKDSLKELTFINAGLLQANFPVFSRLKNLNLYDNGYEFRDRILPKVPSYLPLFPALETVHIGVELHDEELNILFPEDDFRNNCVERFPAVTTVVFSNQSESECISEILFLKFPNVTQLKLGSGSLGKLDHMIWVLPSTVQNLEFSSESFENSDDGNFVNLDSLLTGIPVMKCLELENTSGVVALEADSLRSEPWIGALRNLKHLKINFTGNLVFNTRFLTRVSFLYGFNLMPNLKVTFTYDFNLGGTNNENFRILYGPMLPYVSVQHERNLAEDF